MIYERFGYDTSSFVEIMEIEKSVTLSLLQNIWINFYFFEVIKVLN